jgi:Rps23 Pro-64 3,4-dihydroxylase Tpa1-like proline 4-hydroxylase
MINELDVEALRRRFTNATPFPHIVIENFLERSAAEEIARVYPTFEQAKEIGFAFNAVNEQKKVQITDAGKFPDAVRRLNEAISSPSFLSQVEQVTGIPRLLADERLNGGGMHITGSGGRLDVHVDFNLIEDRKLFRRLNILVYLNPEWREEWGGQIELWDKDVKVRHLSCLPILNRCLIFETSDISYHGVRPVTAPAELVRKSFAAYYYTQEPPAGWNSKSHSTIFRARPDERFRGWVSMPIERLQRSVKDRISRTKRLVKSILTGRTSA